MKRLLLSTVLIFLGCIPFRGQPDPRDRCPVGDEMEVVFRQNTAHGVSTDILLVCQPEKVDPPSELVISRVADCIETHYNVPTNPARATEFQWYSTSGIVAEPLTPGYVVLGVTIPNQKRVYVWDEPRQPNWPSYEHVVSHELIHVITGLGHGSRRLPEAAYEVCSIVLEHQDYYDNEVFIDGLQVRQ